MPVSGQIMAVHFQLNYILLLKTYLAFPDLVADYEEEYKIIELIVG
jgi:hypothetical protein